MRLRPPAQAGKCRISTRLRPDFFATYKRLIGFADQRLLRTAFTRHGSGNAKAGGYAERAIIHRHLRLGKLLAQTVGLGEESASPQPGNRIRNSSPP